MNLRKLGLNKDSEIKNKISDDLKNLKIDITFDNEDRRT